MTGRETGIDDPRTVYADIIDLPRWESPTHPRMPLGDRAAQFAPYAALVGYGDMVKEEGRKSGGEVITVTEKVRRIDTDE